MLKSLEGSKLGIWVAHGEGRFSFPYHKENVAGFSSEFLSGTATNNESVCGGSSCDTAQNSNCSTAKNSSCGTAHDSSCKSESSRVESSRVESSRVESSRVESSRVESSNEVLNKFNSMVKDFCVAVTFNYNSYPANPNGSPLGIAGVCSPDGRHLAMMPHPERCLRPWNWAYYPEHQNGCTGASQVGSIQAGSIKSNSLQAGFTKKMAASTENSSKGTTKDEVTPWLEMFVNARRWCEAHQ